MLSRRAFRPTDPDDDANDQARIQARLDALERDQANDVTRRIHLPTDETAHYDGLLARQEPDSPSRTGPDVETRAYLMTSDGGVLAEIPCSESAGTITLGRGRAAEIKINDPYVHRLQAEIRWDDRASTHFIVHGGGENGTYINRTRIRQAVQLHGGERVRMGKTELVYRIRR